MSKLHPITAVTGSSGAGTSSVSLTFGQNFRREKMQAAFVDGDAFHRFDRLEMIERIAAEAAQGNHRFSHFGPEANLFEDSRRYSRIRRDPRWTDATLPARRR